MRQPFSVLIVDDEPDTLEVLKDVLSRKGYRVVTAEEGREALDKLKSESFHVVMTDIKMPHLDGFLLLETIKKNYPETEVIIFTGYSSIEMAVQTIKKGATDYVVKPIDVEKLLRIIEKIKEAKTTHESQ